MMNAKAMPSISSGPASAPKYVFAASFAGRENLFNIECSTIEELIGKMLIHYSNCVPHQDVNLYRIGAKYNDHFTLFNQEMLKLIGKAEASFLYLLQTFPLEVQSHIESLDSLVGKTFDDSLLKANKSLFETISLMLTNKDYLAEFIKQDGLMHLLHIVASITAGQVDRGSLDESNERAGIPVPGKSIPISGKASASTINARTGLGNSLHNTGGLFMTDQPPVDKNDCLFVDGEPQTARERFWHAIIRILLLIAPFSREADSHVESIFTRLWGKIEQCEQKFPITDRFYDWAICSKDLPGLTTFANKSLTRISTLHAYLELISNIVARSASPNSLLSHISVEAITEKMAIVTNKLNSLQQVTQVLDGTSSPSMGSSGGYQSPPTLGRSLLRAATSPPLQHAMYHQIHHDLNPVKYIQLGVRCLTKLFLLLIAHLDGQSDEAKRRTIHRQSCQQICQALGHLFSSVWFKTAQESVRRQLTSQPEDGPPATSGSLIMETSTLIDPDDVALSRVFDFLGPRRCDPIPLMDVDNVEAQLLLVAFNLRNQLYRSVVKLAKTRKSCQDDILGMTFCSSPGQSMSDLSVECLQWLMEKRHCLLVRTRTKIERKFSLMRGSLWRPRDRRLSLESGLFPTLAVSDKLCQMMIECLQLEDGCDENLSCAIVLHPFMFSVDCDLLDLFKYVFSCLFEACYENWLEIGAKQNDLDKVLNLTRLEFLRALASNTHHQITGLATQLARFSVPALRNQISMERGTELDLRSEHPQIKQLKEDLITNHQRLIKASRLAAMCLHKPLELAEQSRPKIYLSSDHKSLIQRGQGDRTGTHTTWHLEDVRKFYILDIMKKMPKNVPSSLTRENVLVMEFRVTQDLDKDRERTEKFYMFHSDPLVIKDWIDGLVLLQKENSTTGTVISNQSTPIQHITDKFNNDVSSLVDMELQVRILALDAVDFFAPKNFIQ